MLLDKVRGARKLLTFKNCYFHLFGHNFSIVKTTLTLKSKRDKGGVSRKMIPLPPPQKKVKSGQDSTAHVYCKYNGICMYSNSLENLAY